MRDLGQAAGKLAVEEPSPFGFKKYKSGKGFHYYIKLKKDQRRFDVTLTDAGSEDKALGIDVSVASPFAASVINKTEPLAAAIDREQEKSVSTTRTTQNTTWTPMEAFPAFLTVKSFECSLRKLRTTFL